MNQTPVHVHSVRQDILASLVVFLVALPLSLGIALASGAPPVAALAAAIIGGIVVGAISGAPLVVTGPAAGLSAIVLGYVQTYGLEKLFQITVLAGIIQVVFAGMRTARFIQKLPKTVVEGVLSAIGLIIVLGQIHIIMGQKIPGGPVTNILGMSAAFSAMLAGPGKFALLVGVASLMVIVSWKHVSKKFAWLPAALPGVLIGTLASISFTIPRISVGPLGAHITDALNNTLNYSFWSGMISLLMPALGLAIVASAESLLTARSVDVLASKKHLKMPLDVNRELFAQGVGNFVSGIFGGLPLSGVMVRSAANIEAGASSRKSTIMHGVWIAGFVILVPQVLSVIPLAALAAVLIFTGIKLLNISHMIEAFRSNAKEAWIWPATLVAVVSTDLLKGLFIGIALALANQWVLSRKLKESEQEDSRFEAKSSVEA